jgi:phenylacetate-CoA ligase
MSMEHSSPGQFSYSDGEPVSPGERWKLVCAGLLSHAMPFIRYNMGNVGSLSDENCPCGRGLPIFGTP